MLFSALTVAVAMSGSLVFPIDIPRSPAWTGIMIVVSSAAAAILALPALLALLGPRSTAGTCSPGSGAPGRLLAATARARPVQVAGHVPAWGEAVPAGAALPTDPTKGVESELVTP